MGLVLDSYYCWLISSQNARPMPIASVILSLASRFFSRTQNLFTFSFTSDLPSPFFDPLQSFRNSGSTNKQSSFWIAPQQIPIAIAALALCEKHGISTTITLAL